MRYRISKHASEERFERMCFLMEKVGLGTEICSCSTFNDRTLTLTSTGIVLVIGSDNCVITAYVTTMKEAIKIWRNTSPTHAQTKMPNWLYEKIIANRPYYEECHQLDEMLNYHTTKKTYRFF